MKKLHSIMILLLMLAFVCDVPGPWEYDVEEIPVHYGLYVNGYVIAGRPITAPPGAPYAFRVDIT